MNKRSTAITRDTFVSQVNDLVTSDLEGEVVMSIESGNYFGLNPVGSRIWELIEQPVKVAEVVEKLLGNSMFLLNSVNRKH
jgi:hypothetical protein